MAQPTADSPSHADPTAGPLADQAFPDVAAALRSATKAILLAWEGQVRRHVPPAQAVAFAEVLDHLPDILGSMADALASGDAAEVNRLMERSPEQGVHRFTLHYDVRQLATEDRLLRQLINEHVGSALGRRTTAGEDTALNWVIDLMVQQAVVAFVGHQNARLREAAEAELQYLSFLSHDLSGNLGNITIWLQIMRRGLAAAPQFGRELAALDTAQQSILDTMGGMGRLLQAERLRHGRAEPKAGPVDLCALADAVAAPFVRQAGQKGLALTVDVPAGTTVTSDGELITLALQNLVGNAVKYTARGAVRVGAERGRADGWAVDGVGRGPGPGHRGGQAGADLRGLPPGRHARPGGRGAGAGDRVPGGQDAGRGADGGVDRRRRLDVPPGPAPDRLRGDRARPDGRAGRAG